MPRAALARTTFAVATAASTTGLFGGYVPIGASDVVPDAEMSGTQALVGEVVAEKRVNFAIDDFATGKTLLAGTVEQRVVMEAEKQSITFHYLITKAPGPAATSEVFRASAFSFGELVQTDVGYLIDDHAEGSPSRVGRTSNALDVHFDGTEGALSDGGGISFYVRTNATQFDETGMFALDAMASNPDPVTGTRVRSDVANGLYRAVVLEGPVAVPLPGAIYSGVMGLAGVAWLRRRVKR